MGKTFQATHLTHETFLTIDHSGKTFFWYLPKCSTHLWCVCTIRYVSADIKEKKKNCKSLGGAKGQIISKCFFVSLISSKKQTKEFNFTAMIPQVDLFSFVFWRKSKTSKKPFRNYLTFNTRSKPALLEIDCAWDIMPDWSGAKPPHYIFFGDFPKSLIVLAKCCQLSHVASSHI